jgi:hypothetical protein
MHEALCRPSDTTLDILHVESRAADHSANMGSSAAITLEIANNRIIGIGCFPYRQCYYSLAEGPLLKSNNLLSARYRAEIAPCLSMLVGGTLGASILPSPIKL